MIPAVSLAYSSRALVPDLSEASIAPAASLPESAAASCPTPLTPSISPAASPAMKILPRPSQTRSFDLKSMSMKYSSLSTTLPPILNLLLT